MALFTGILLTELVLSVLAVAAVAEREELTMLLGLAGFETTETGLFTA